MNKNITQGLHSPKVNVLQYEVLGGGMARVLCSISHVGDSRTDSKYFAPALKKALNDRMQAVAGTFQELDKGKFKQHVTGIVSVVHEAMPMIEGSMKGFKALAANMFLDDEENMWAVRKTQAGDLLVKTTGIEDDMSLAQLLSQCTAKMTSLNNTSEYTNLVAQASAQKSKIKGGQYATYVNLGEVRHGYVVATSSDDQAVMMDLQGEVSTVSLSAVTEIHQTTDFPQYEMNEQERIDLGVAQARGDVNLQMMLDYYKKVFIRDKKFYEMFAQRLRNHSFA